MARSPGCWNRHLPCGDGSASPPTPYIGSIAGGICPGPSRTRTRGYRLAPCVPQARRPAGTYCPPCADGSAWRPRPASLGPPSRRFCSATAEKGRRCCKLSDCRTHLWRFGRCRCCCASYPRPILARVAGESLSLITGVDIAGEDLERDAPDGFETSPHLVTYCFKNQPSLRKGGFDITPRRGYIGLASRGGKIRRSPGLEFGQLEL